MNSDLNLRSFYAGDPLKDQQLLQLLITCIEGKKQLYEENYHSIAITNYFKDVNLQKQHANTFKPYEEDFLIKKYQMSSNISSFTGKIKQYSRLTLEASDVKFLHQIKQDNQFLSSYDLIAIKPKSEAVFGHLCTTLTYFDIVTFDCFEKLPFIPKAKICQLLLEKNIMFELNYGDAVQDPNKRRQFISNASIIIKSTKGKNILMSSDTSYWLYHRSPYDLVALGMMVGLKKDQATQAVTVNAEMAIKHASILMLNQFIEKLLRVQFVKRHKKMQSTFKGRKRKSMTNNLKKQQKKQNYLKMLMQKNDNIIQINDFQINSQVSILSENQIAHGRNTSHTQEINKNIRKENLDIQRTFQKLSNPLWTKVTQKVSDNKNRIYLFCGLVFLCQLKFIYDLNLGRIPYRRLAFNKFKSYFLGQESVYPKSIVEQIFINKLPQDFMIKFIKLDKEFPLGITKKFIIRCLNECQVSISKEAKQTFYTKHGLLYGSYAKSGGVNFKELNDFLQQFEINYNKLVEAMDTMKDQEMQWQKNVQQKYITKPPQYSSNSTDAITRRIQPRFDKL